MLLKRYWFVFDLSVDDPHPPGVLAGCGVTAWSYEDALDLLRKRVFSNCELPKVVKVLEDVDVSTLDPGHVLPNMASPNYRGIWFPLGYGRA